MQETKLTITIGVSEGDSHVVIYNPSTTEAVSMPVLMGVFKSLADFAKEWNEEHKPENRETMTQEEIQHIKKLKDAGFDCSTSRSIDETIQLLKLLKGETRKI
jgi:tRNA threonylcarbamoyladenosine modification (KEOPS) complex Cgi121 subunit